MSKIKLKRLGGVIVLVMMLVVAMSTSASFAAIPDTAGNTFGVEDNGNINCEKDYYWIGSRLNGENIKIGYDAIVCGQTIDFTLGTIGGSVRAAGQTINISDVTIGHNVTLAGQNIKIDTGTTMEGAYIAGSEIQFNGTTNALTIACGDAVIDGTVNGDVIVYAGEVTFGPNAVVTGTVRGTVGDEPEIANTTNVPSVNVTIEESDDSSKAMLLGFGIIAKLVGIIGSIILGAFMCLVFKKPLASAARAVKQKPAAMLVTGLVSVIAVPIVCLILLVTVIGIPISFLIFALYVLITAISVAFSGASFGQAIFPTWNRWGASMLSVVILAIVASIPYVGMIAKLAAMSYALGYFMLMAYYQIKDN